jgi:hypothetical protein
MVVAKERFDALLAEDAELARTIHELADERRPAKPKPAAPTPG